MTITDTRSPENTSTDDTSTTIAPARTQAEWVQLARDIGVELEPGVAERDVSGEISHEGYERLRASGLTSALVPVEFGGGGATHADMGAVLRELGRHDPATAVALSMHAHLVAAQVWRHNHGMDAEKIFRKVVDDRAVLISTGASDWLSSNGTARKVEGGYRVTARKAPASGCDVGDIAVSSIRWEDGPDGPMVLHFSVPMSAEGVSIELTWDTLGMRATGSHTIVLDDVFVPDAAVSLERPADRWHPIWNIVLGSALPLIVAAYVGVGDRAVELAREAATGRTEPHVLQVLGEMMNAYTTATDVAAAMFTATENLQFANTDDGVGVMLSRKTVACEALIETVRLALEVTGGSGYTRSSPIERLYRDIHGCLFHPLPRAKQTQITGRVTLGLSPVG